MVLLRKNQAFKKAHRKFVLELETDSDHCLRFLNPVITEVNEIPETDKRTIGSKLFMSSNQSLP